jgi:hypothetical protein
VKAEARVRAFNPQTAVSPAKVLSERAAQDSGAMEPEWNCSKVRDVSNDEAVAFVQSFIAASGPAEADNTANAGGIDSADGDMAIAEDGSQGAPDASRRKYTPADTSRLLRALKMDVQARTNEKSQAALSEPSAAS